MPPKAKSPAPAPSRGRSPAAAAPRGRSPAGRASSRGNSSAPTTPAKKVLAAILKAQEDPRHGYARALREIQTGQKVSCWIWWIWPALAPVRITSRPQYGLPDFAAALEYLQHPVLRPRLLEITSCAVEHLQKGVRPTVVFGSTTDATKYHETATYFFIAALESQDWETADVLRDSLEAYGGRLDDGTMRVLIQDAPLDRYKRLTTADQCAAAAQERLPPDDEEGHGPAAAVVAAAAVDAAPVADT